VGSTRQEERGVGNGPDHMVDSVPMNVQQWLTVDSWLAREQRRGYESSPNTSEFSDLNDLSNARNLFYEKEVQRIKELVEKNPQILKEVEARVKGKRGVFMQQTGDQSDDGGVGPLGTCQENVIHEPEGIVWR
jgi:hypothetical protein